MKEKLIITNIWDGLTHQITSTIRVEFKDSSFDHNCKAVWDTGATHSLVLPKFAKKHELIKHDEIEVSFKKNTYWRRFRTKLYLTDEIYFNDFVMTECDLDWDNDIIIGMDIIRLGNFYIINKEGKTHFGFSLSDDVIKNIKRKIW